MKSLTILFIFLAIGFCSFAQEPIVVPEAHIKFKFPNEEWKLKNRSVTKTKAVVYNYERTAIVSGKNKVIPTVSIICEKVPMHTQIGPYSTQKTKPLQQQKNFKTTKVFTHSDGMLKLEYAVGYKCFYDDAAGTNHTLYVIHAVHEGAGIQVWIDITTGLFTEYETEITDIIRAMEYVR